MKRTLPTVLLGEIVGYLDITEDRFLPGFKKQWAKATHFRTEEQDDEQDPNARTVYLVNDKIHSWKDQPAIEWANGDDEWFFQDKRHRGHGKPAIVRSRGRREWYRHGRRVMNWNDPDLAWIEILVNRSVPCFSMLDIVFYVLVFLTVLSAARDIFCRL